MTGNAHFCGFWLLRLKLDLLGKACLTLIAVFDKLLEFFFSLAPTSSFSVPKLYFELSYNPNKSLTFKHFEHQCMSLLKLAPTGRRPFAVVQFPLTTERK